MTKNQNDGGGLGGNAGCMVAIGILAFLLFMGWLKMKGG